MSEQQQQQEMSDEEALMKLAQAMKDNAPSGIDKQSVYAFLNNIAVSDDSRKVANLRNDKELDELGTPLHHVRGSLEMARISAKIIENDYFTAWFEAEAEETLSTSLSREGFLVKSATTQTKQVADITRRRKINKGWFGSKKIEESGGNTLGNN